MKRIVGFVAIAVTLCAATTEVLAQETQYLRTPHHFTLFVDGGMAIPAAPEIFKKAWNTTLPINIGIGYSIFAWWDVNLVYTRAGFGSNSLEAQRQIGFNGRNTLEGGDITTTSFLVTNRFIAVPNQRANPYFEVGLGSFSTSAADLEVEGTFNTTQETVTFVNTMESTSGLSVVLGMGLQYALNERWSTYTKFSWTFNLDSSFSPSDLLIDQSAGETPSEDGDGSQEFASIIVGLMIRM